MEGLILGALGYYGNNIKNNKKNIENVENIENKMKIIEETQSKNLKSDPEFFKQFDQLSFNNIGGPTAENQSYTTNNGINGFFQRDIEFKNGYSEFQNSDMHYGITTRENFTHENMTPNTSRRDTLNNLESSSRKYENLSGNNKYWQHKKETSPLFEPMSNLSNPFGMPVVAGKLGDRYIASFKNNHGNLPFQTETKVLPGIEGNTAKGAYSVYRINPRNVDELRSETNQKVSYLNKPLETIKKGDFRASEGTISKFKIPSYKNVLASDLVPNASVNNLSKQTGEFVHIDSQRGQQDYNYTGPSYNTSKGKKVEGKYATTKKENYLNDFTHAINAVNTRPIFQNQESLISYDNQRDTTNNQPSKSGLSYNLGGSYHIDRKDIMKETVKQTTIEGHDTTGLRGTVENKSYILSNDSVLPTTHRNTTTRDIVLNPSSSYQNINVQYNDLAKRTIRETSNQNIITNVSSQFQNIANQDIKEAKQTIRETTNDNIITNVSTPYQNINSQYTDKAKQTIRETNDGNIITNVSVPYQNIANQNIKEARTTIRESTNDNIITNVSVPYQNIANQNIKEAKSTIRETTNDNIITNVSVPYQNIANQNIKKAKSTIRESTNDNIITNVSVPYQNITNQNIQEANPTVKQTTVENNIISNVSTPYQNISNQYCTPAKKTIRETIETNNIVSNVSAPYQNINSQFTDEARHTIRETTEINNIISNLSAPYHNTNNQPTDIAKTTIRQTTNNNIISNVSAPFRTTNNQPTDEARTTIRESTENNNIVTNIVGPYRTPVNSLSDKAKETTKQTTVENNIISNMSTSYQSIINPYGDIAKTTVKESTLYNIPEQNIKSIVSNIYSKNDNDIAKTTINETTISAVPLGRAIDLNFGSYHIDRNDVTKTTTKESTMTMDHTGGTTSYVKNAAIENINVDLNDCRQTLAMSGRTPGAKSDQIRGDINKDTIKYNDRKMIYGYVSAPGQALNHSIICDRISKVSNHKTNLNNNFYNIDPIFISTLNNNPLVNDLMHQKNYN